MSNSYTSQITMGIGSISKININASSISITGFHFHPYANNPVAEWIDRIFGNMSVHYASNTMFEFMKMRKLHPIEIQNSYDKIRNKINADEISNKRPKCSIDLIGLVAAGETNKHVNPFTKDYKSIGPAIGNATLDIPSISGTWKCYYRALYENWRPEERLGKSYFWTTMFYCPQYNQDLCEDLLLYQNQNSLLPSTISMKVDGETWSNSFIANLANKIDGNPRNSTFGVCIAIPYSSTDEDKADANGAMFQDWIRYYSRLGIRVFIYDRDGMSYKYVSEVLKTDDLSRRHTIYYNYTMRGLLDPESRGLKYDNNEMLGDLIYNNTEDSVLLRQGKQGFDKTHTLTQCRYEAKAVYGIDNVLVADYDEFLYCPKANPTAESQSNFILNLIKSMKEQGQEQVTFDQRLLLNRTVSPRDCVIGKSREKTSIFDCFASYHYHIDVYSIKSFHLGYLCPLTGYHSACPMHPKQQRILDCKCNSIDIDSTVCSFIHFSTNQRAFSSRRLTKYKFVSDDRNEISKILYDT